ncbi:MAG: hypothetical protein V1769_05935 [Thermoplasmatota archaeon]
MKLHCIVGGYKLFCKPSSLEKEGRLVKRMGWDALKLPVQFLLILGTSMLLSIFFADAYIINSAGERKKGIILTPLSSSSMVVKKTHNFKKIGNVFLEKLFYIMRVVYDKE